MYLLKEPDIDAEAYADDFAAIEDGQSILSKNIEWTINMLGFADDTSGESSSNELMCQVLKKLSYL
ncbi:MAG: hypothetical protein U9N81_12335 [Bacillota bacterium]|nr:hypothetical protein [Bacillota bacterium]